MIPTFSIVTPSLNQGEFIEECILSVLSQEGNFFIDYIVVDGGSTDNSLEIIKKYASLLVRGEWPVKCRGIQYRWSSGADTGQSNAINRGFQMTTGDIAAWLNSDDYYLAGAFAKVKEAFARDDDLSVIYGDGDIADIKSKSRKPSPVEEFFDLWKLIHLYDFILQPSVFMKYSALKQAGFLDENLHYIMDWELWIRLSRFGRIRHIGEKFSCARSHPAAKTQTSGINRWKEIRSVSAKYGHMKFPPVVFTQFFHRPYNILSGENRKEREPLIPVSILNSLRKAYYRVIGDNRSGLHIGGHAERAAHLSVPLREEVSKITIMIKPLIYRRVKYFVNNGYAGSLKLDDQNTSFDIKTTDTMKKSGFLHLKFLAENESEYGIPNPPGTKDSFIITDIILFDSEGRHIRDIGVPEFRISHESVPVH